MRFHLCALLLACSGCSAILDANRYAAEDASNGTDSGARDAAMLRDAAQSDAARSDAAMVDAGTDAGIDPTPWLAGNFQYRVPLTIDLPTSVADVQYFFPLDTATLITAGKLRADGADIRITQDDGVTPRPFWIEPPLNEARTRIWFTVPALAAGVHRFYLYYGDSAATSASSGTDTFALFDDFTALDTNRWNTAVLGTGSVSIFGGHLRLSATTGPAGTTNLASIIFKDANGFSGPVGIVARLVNVTVGVSTRADVVFRSTNTGDYFNNGTWARTSFDGRGTPVYEAWASGSSGGITGGAAATMVIPDSAPYTLVVARDDASPTIRWLFGNPLTEVGTGANITSWSAANLKSPSLVGRSYENAPAFDYRFDWVFVFRFADLFQTVQLGTEQINPAL